MAQRARNLRLRDLRAKKGWTQPELARRARVGIATINQAETGKRVPHVTTQEKIARALGVPRDVLFPEPESVGVPA
jgi:transcriptional regulator with XRE-family HTH domain